jgi:hypothetical protein
MKHNKASSTKKTVKKAIKTQGKNTLSFLGIPFGKIPKGMKK